MPKKNPLISLGFPSDRNSSTSARFIFVLPRISKVLLFGSIYLKTSPHKNKEKVAFEFCLSRKTLFVCLFLYFFFFALSWVLEKNHISRIINTDISISAFHLHSLILTICSCLKTGYPVPCLPNSGFDYSILLFNSPAGDLLMSC